MYAWIEICLVIRHSLPVDIPTNVLARTSVTIWMQWVCTFFKLPMPLGLSRLGRSSAFYLPSDARFR